MPTFDNNNNQPPLFADADRIRRYDAWQLHAEARRLQSEELARLARLAAARGMEFVRSYVLAPAELWFLRRKLYQTLSDLDDRMLEDIGVARHEIGLVVQMAYPGKAAAGPAPAPKAALHLLDAGRNRSKAAAAAEDSRPQLAA